MRISDWSADVCSSDLMNYEDLGLAWPEGLAHSWSDEMGWPERAKLPDPEDPSDLVLFDRNTGERFTFNSRQELDHFKYQRYIKRYLRTVVAIDENVGRLLDWLDEDGIAEDTIVVYTSDQGFFLGEHGWFDKRFIYEDSLQMPSLLRSPATRSEERRVGKESVRTVRSRWSPNP